ncbi:MAG: hypothetical protein ACQES4_04430 [Bacillota bacterium]
MEENDELENKERKLSEKEIKEKIEALKKRKDRYEQMEEQLEESGESEISTTDPDSRLMSSGDGKVDVSYNVQTAVDSKHKLIVNKSISSRCGDKCYLD